MDTREWKYKRIYGWENRKAVCLCLKYTLLLWWWFSLSVMPSSFVTHGLYPTRLLCPWNFPGKNTGAGCCFLLQGIFLTQGSNLGLPHCRQILPRWRQILYCLSHQGSPIFFFVFKHCDGYRAVYDILKFFIKLCHIQLCTPHNAFFKKSFSFN